MNADTGILNGTANQVLSQALNNVWFLINHQRAEESVAACLKLNANYPDSDDGWFATSFLAFQMRKAPEALKAINQAIKLAPKKPRWLLHKAHTLLVLGQQAEALLLAEALTGKSYSEVDFCAELAMVLNKLSQYKSAGEYY